PLIRLGPSVRSTFSPLEGRRIVRGGVSAKTQKQQREPPSPLVGEGTGMRGAQPVGSQPAFAGLANSAPPSPLEGAPSLRHTLSSAVSMPPRNRSAPLCIDPGVLCASRDN